MAKPGHILIVCTANICRSPMGAGLLRHALAPLPEPLGSLRVTSAGVAARPGEPATGHAITVLRRSGIDISGHRSRPLEQDLLDGALAVFCMTEAHRTLIQLRASPPPGSLHLFREFMPAAADREIADPYGGPLGVYETSRDEMVEAIPSLLAYLKTRIAQA